MASVSQFYTADHKGLSFELFPPKTDKGDAALMRHTEALMKFSPDYITCTYGAGGSTPVSYTHLTLPTNREV